MLQNQNDLLVWVDGLGKTISWELWDKELDCFNCTNSLMITILVPIVYDGQIYLSIYKSVLWCLIQISCVHTFMVNYLYIKLVVVCRYCFFNAFLIIWADNLCKLNHIWQATIPFVKINMTPVGYSFCGAVQFSNKMTLCGFLQWISTRHSLLS